MPRLAPEIALRKQDLSRHYYILNVPIHASDDSASIYAFATVVLYYLDDARQNVSQIVIFVFKLQKLV